MTDKSKNLWDGKGIIPPVGIQCLMLWDSQNKIYAKVFTIGFDNEKNLCVEVLDRICDQGGIVTHKISPRDNSVALPAFKPLDPEPSDLDLAIEEACKIIAEDVQCKNWNINIDCSLAQKAAVVALVKAGYRMKILHKRKFRKGDTYQAEGSENYTSGITIDNWGNVIECYGKTEDLAEQLRDHVLLCTT